MDVTVVPCPSCARIIAQDGRVEEVSFANSTGLNMSGVETLLSKGVRVVHVNNTAPTWLKGGIFDEQLILSDGAKLAGDIWEPSIISKLRGLGRPGRTLRYFPQVKTLLVDAKVAEKLNIQCEKAKFRGMAQSSDVSAEEELLHVLHIESKTHRPLFMSHSGNIRRIPSEGRSDGAGAGGSKSKKAPPKAPEAKSKVKYMSKTELSRIGQGIVSGDKKWRIQKYERKVKWR